MTDDDRITHEQLRSNPWNDTAPTEDLEPHCNRCGTLVRTCNVCGDSFCYRCDELHNSRTCRDTAKGFERAFRCTCCGDLWRLDDVLGPDNCRSCPYCDGRVVETIDVAGWTYGAGEASGIGTDPF